MSKALGALALVFMSVSASGCWDIWEEAADQVIEGEMGCSEQQLAPINEPALPNCSKLAACCKFLKGECGAIQYFTAPQSVIDLCNTNEALFLDFIDTYADISEGNCPKYLTDEACQGTVGDTKTTYVSVVDEGSLEGAAGESPSCNSMLEATVVPLNEALGATAEMLPAACEL